MPKFDIGYPKHPGAQFGDAHLRYSNNGKAYWSRVNTLSQWQKGNGWQACLYGGIQSAWDDWAAIFIPTNEVYLPDFNKTTEWSYYMTNAEAMGVNIVIWVHDPLDFTKRAEITQQADIATLGKASGWNSHKLLSTTDQFYFFGENTTGTDLTAAPPNYYGLDDFQADALFKGWTVYRVSLEYGWHTGNGVFEEAWVSEVKLNNIIIPMIPDVLEPMKQYATAAAAALANTLAPKTPFRLLSVDLTINTAGTTDESFTITQDAGLGAAYDRLIVTQNTKTPAITSLYLPFGIGYEFGAEDELDAAWPNTENRTYGLVWTWEPI